MSSSVDRVREDFDRIARLAAGHGELPGLYDDFLLRQIPAAAERVLEVGCGSGALSRALAARGHRVTAVDLSPEMIHLAEQRTPPAADVTYRCGDFLRMALDAQPYDGVVSSATLHHVPLEAGVERLAAAVRPGGTLVVHDLRSDAGGWDHLHSAIASAARGWARLRAGRLREDAAVRAAWREHGRGERYPTLREVEAWAGELLPGARVVRHLQWRYTVVWQRPHEGLGPPPPLARTI